MSESEQVEVIVKPAEIFLLTDHPQTLSQKLTLYNLSNYKVLFQVRVNPPKRYVLSRTRGLLDAYCYVNIAIRYIPDSKDANVRSTDKIFFEITACKDANSDFYQFKNCPTTLIHLLNSAIIFPNGLNKLTGNNSCGEPPTADLEKTEKPNLCRMISSILKVIFYMGIAIICAYALSSITQTPQSGLSNGRTERFQISDVIIVIESIRNKVSSLVGIFLTAFPHIYQLFMAYCLGVVTMFAIVSLKII